jgi:ribonuclease HI
VSPAGPFACGPAAGTTNQRMEITAVLEAVRANPGPLEVRSDSTYVVNCFRDRWWEGWLARGWLTSARKPVANRDLWEPLVELVRARGDVRFTWVKGHSGEVWNEVADRLAVDALRRGEPRAGAVLPPQLAGATPAAAPPADSPPTVDGHALVVVGQQDGDGAAARAWLAQLLVARRRAVTDLVVVTGLRRGAEQWAAQAAAEVGVPYVAVLPWPGPDADWPPADRAVFAELAGGAQRQVVLQGEAPSGPGKARAALERRNAWLARAAAEAVVVWDGADERLGRFHRSLVDHLGERAVTVLEPGGGVP